MATGKPEMEVREELRWAERRGTYQRLSPWKIKGELWRSTLEAVGLQEKESEKTSRRSETFEKKV